MYDENASERSRYSRPVCKQPNWPPFKPLKVYLSESGICARAVELGEKTRLRYVFINYLHFHLKLLFVHAEVSILLALPIKIILFGVDSSIGVKNRVRHLNSEKVLMIYFSFIDIYIPLPCC